MASTAPGTSRRIHFDWIEAQWDGKLGRADWRDFRRQMSSASCLTPIMAAIIYWQIREIERAVAEANEGELARLRLDLLSHVSPIGWENVTLYGEYVLRPGLVRA